MASKARNRIWTAIMWLAIVVFLVSAGYLALIAYSYWNDANRYQEISDTMFDPRGDLASMAVDWDALRAINSQVVAWVYVPGTVISYPVCYSGDNQKYLDINFDGEQGVWTGCGTIFLDGANSPAFTDNNSILYGHHMNDGSMFACLSDFAAEEVFEEHRDVYLLTPERNYRFKSFSLVRTNGSDTTLAIVNFSTPSEMAEYVRDKEERSMVTPEDGFPVPSEVRQMLTLSTCDYNEYDGRAVLFCNLEEAATPISSSSNVIGNADGYVSG